MENQTKKVREYDETPRPFPAIPLRQTADGRTAEPYSAESIRVLAAKYAALLRTTLRGIGHIMDAITIQTPPVN